MTSSVATEPDFRAITHHQRRAWAGDSARASSVAALHGELLCDAVDVHPGERVLDVAAGSGAAAIAAARRWADVIAIDFVEGLLDSAERVAEAYDLPMTTRVADAQALPFEDDTFDVVLSAFGAMFAPDQQAAADELVRVCRPGGRIGMLNWVPNSLIGEVFRVTGRRRQGPPGLRSPIEWGMEDRLRELFGNRISSLRIEPRTFVFRYRSPAHMLEWFRAWDGPTRTAFENLHAEGQAQLAAELVETFQAYNRADDGTLVAPSGYVEVVAVVR